MFIKKLFVEINLFSLLALLLIAPVAAQDAKSVSFERDIKPILENHCISCHGPVKEEGTRLDIRDDALDYIEVGDPENSVFYECLITEDEEELMPPPDEENPLTERQISLVKTWIAEGAEWPDGIEVVDAQIVESADGSTDDGTETGTKSEPVKAAQGVDDEVLWNAIGSLHPAAIHLPIGLLLAAGLFALFSIRGNFVMGDCAYYCLWLGTIGACIATATGWWFCEPEHRDTVVQFSDLLDQEQDIFWHRTTALICTAFSILLCLFAAGARARDPDDGVMWKIGLMILAVGICITGHEGGNLTHGKDLYKDLNTIFETIIPMDMFGGSEADVPALDEAADQTGATSEETQ
jgi:hypothetical protein